eukprot:evm.model.NODE_21442_length_9164_cov_35.499783.2
MFGANTEAKKKATEEILRQTRAASHVDVHKGEDDLWKLASERLCHQIKTDGTNLGKGILKVHKGGREGRKEGGKEGGKDRGRRERREGSSEGQPIWG